MKKYLHCILLTILVITLSACEPIGAQETTETAVITTVTETAREPVMIYGVSFDAPPESIICLSPAITEIIYEIGMSEKLIGVGEYCDYPTAAMAENAVCGSAANPDFNTILSLSPNVLITQSPIANKDLTRLKNAGIIVLSIPAVTDINSLEALYGNLEKLFSFEEESDIPGLTALNNDLSQNDIDLGNFIYYLSDDFTAAGTDTFSGSFFDHFGKNLCGEISKPMPLEVEDTVEAADTTEAEDTTGTADIVTPDTIILPAYLMDFTDNYLAENPSRVIILTEQSTSLLERPTDRIRLVIDELKAGFSDNTETGETVTDVADTE